MNSREQIYKAALEEIALPEGELGQCRGCGWQIEDCTKAADRDCVGYVARAALEAAAKVGGLADDIEFAAGVGAEYHNMNCLQKCGEVDYDESATVGDVLRAIDAYLRGAR